MGTLRNTLRASKTARAPEKHGMAGTLMYYRWQAMLNRCHTSSSTRYAPYGGRGIRVCTAWHTFVPFLRYVQRLPGYGEAGMQLDRINNNAGYRPGNVRWASARENSRNKRNSVYRTLGTETKTLAEWAEDPRCAVAAVTFRGRLRKGMDVLTALTMPPLRPPVKHNGTFFECWGESKTLNEWATDPRCAVCTAALRYRLGKGRSLADAITAPARQ